MFSLDMDMSILVLVFVLPVLILVTLCVCKAKLLYLGLNLAGFYLLSHTADSSCVPWTWLGFAAALGFLLGTSAETDSTEERPARVKKWRSCAAGVLVADLIFGNIYNTFFTRSYWFLIPWFVANLVAYIGALIALPVQKDSEAQMPAEEAKETDKR